IGAADLAREIDRARQIESLLDRDVDHLRELRVHERREPRFGMVERARLDLRETLRERLRDLSPVTRHPDARRVDARAAAVRRDRLDDDVDPLGPVVDSILADEDLAPARSMALDAVVLLPAPRRRHVAEDHAAL